MTNPLTGNAYFRTGKAVRVPLVTTLFYHAAQLGNVSVMEFLADPARLTRSLLDLQKLFETDVVAIKFERAFLDAAGVDADDADPSISEPLPFLPEPETILAAAGNLLDVTGRIAAETRKRMPILAMLPSPGSLVAAGEDQAPAAAAVRSITEAACKAGATIVMFDGGHPDDSRESFTRAISPAVNIARYYSAVAIVSDRPDAPKSIADALLLSDPQVQMPAGGQRLGLRYDLDDPTGAESWCRAFPAGSSVPFLSFDDADIRERPVEEIKAAFDRLRAIDIS